MPPFQSANNSRGGGYRSHRYPPTGWESSAHRRFHSHSGDRRDLFRGDDDRRPSQVPHRSFSQLYGNRPSYPSVTATPTEVQSLHPHQRMQRRLAVFLPVGGAEVGFAAGGGLQRGSGGNNLPCWRHLPFNPYMLAASGSDSATGTLRVRQSASGACTATMGNGGGFDTISDAIQNPQRMQQSAVQARTVRTAATAATMTSTAVPPATSEPHEELSCDPCQKTFRSRETYEAHMAKHIYCEVPGCHFTCKADKAWKLEAHMDLLHNRPDAPTLADPEKYLEQRRQRFPTTKDVQRKVEELYYKAARGAIMPDERRRWMRQHGIYIGKRPRTEHTYIAKGCLHRGESSSKEEGDSVTAPLLRECRSRSGSSSCSSSSSSSTSRSASSGTLLRSSRSSSGKGDVPRLTAMTPQGEPTTTAAAEATPPPVHARPATAAAPLLQKVLRSPAARVELNRKDGSARVPRFYVCNRCGEKGTHWVGQCPTTGDSRFDRHMIWGEARRAPPAATTSPSLATTTAPEVTKDAMTSTAAVLVTRVSPVREAESTPAQAHRTQPEPPASLTSAEDVDDAPPPAMSARRDPRASADAAATNSDNDGNTINDTNDCKSSIAADEARPRERTRIIAPVAAARLAAAANGGRGRGNAMMGRGRHGGAHGHVEASVHIAPTLYERLTEEDRLTENGLLLQAIRFFVARDFFE